MELNKRVEVKLYDKFIRRNKVDKCYLIKYTAMVI